MIGLSSKVKNIIFWISTVLVSLIVFGVFIIDTFVTDAHGKDKLSIVFSYLSTVFAFLSALGLFTTIGVYFWQKKDAINKDTAKDELNNTAYNKVIYDEGMKIKESLEQLMRIKASIIASNGNVEIVTTNNFNFIKPINDPEILLLLRNTDSIREIYVSSSSCSNEQLYESARFIYEINNQIHNLWLCSLIFCDSKDDSLISIASKYLEYWKSADLKSILTSINYAINLIESENSLDKTLFFHKSTDENGDMVITVKKTSLH